MEDEEEGRSYQRLAQIFATLASGFFLVAGVFISLGSMIASTSFDIFNLQYKLATNMPTNSTANSTNNYNITDPAINLIESSMDFYKLGFAFLAIGMILAVWSYIKWKQGHSKICE